jgi:hypothetical protein
MATEMGIRSAVDIKPPRWEKCPPMKKGSEMKQVHGRQVVVTALLAGLLVVGPRSVAADADGGPAVGRGGRSGTEQAKVLLDADGSGHGMGSGNRSGPVQRLLDADRGGFIGSGHQHGVGGSGLLLEAESGGAAGSGHQHRAGGSGVVLDGENGGTVGSGNRSGMEQTQRRLDENGGMSGSGGRSETEQRMLVDADGGGWAGSGHQSSAGGSGVLLNADRGPHTIGGGH